MKLIDVSVRRDATLPTSPGNVAFRLEPIKRIAKRDSSNVSAVHLSARAGTHADAPRHFFDHRSGAEALPLERLFGRTRVSQIRSRRGVYEIYCLPLTIVGADGAPARVVLRHN